MSAFSDSQLREIRADFPALHQDVNGTPLVYLDNAASSLTPQPVIHAITSFYAKDRANVHRGVHTLSQRASTRYEAVREKLHQFLGADDDTEIIFTSGTTIGFNMLAHGVTAAFRKQLEQPDAVPQVMLSELEHHANIVPWHMMYDLAAQCTKNPFLRYFEFDQSRGLLNHPDKNGCDILSLTALSNATGVIVDTNAVVELFNTPPQFILIDGAQDVVHRHRPLDALIFDAYVFSGHKMCGPTGSGAIAIKKYLLDQLSPLIGGGDMIQSVSWHQTTFQKGVHKLEAGTPSIASVIGLGAAVDYLSDLDVHACHAHEHALMTYAEEQLSRIDGCRIIAPGLEKAGALSFVVDGTHPHDVGTLLDEQGVAVRTGQHCTEPLMNKLGVPGTVRASFMFYNTPEEVDRLVNATTQAVALLR